ncbi:unnamed protein product [Phytomonas sp. Hart1]|nr:unnamed protein product [Phytomonas sp. Hart1]|eukprot:CCW66794.1 unnamed protein product [Phytomonas sp. isolate Hart1]
MQDIFTPEGNSLPSIVFDCGAHHTRAGYGGGFSPRLDIPTLVGYPRHRGVAMAAGMNELEVGESALSKRGMLSVCHPIEDGLITNWDAMEGFWSDLLYSQLRATPESHAFLTTQPVNTPASQREGVLELLMETFHVHSLYLGTSQVLSLYAYGLTTGVVVDSGLDRTLAVPIHEGHPMGRHVTESRVAGALLTNYLGSLLREEGYSLSTAVERTLLNEAKEDLCFVKHPRWMDKWMHASLPEETFPNDNLSSFDCSKNRLEVGLSAGTVEEYGNESKEIAFDLPDGQSIPLYHHRHYTPEVLFDFSILEGKDWLEKNSQNKSNESNNKLDSGDPSHISSSSYEPPYKVRIELGEWFTPSFPKGISWLPFSAIHRCDQSLQPQLYANIVLAGNTLNFPGTRSRMNEEIIQLYREKHSNEAVLPINVRDMNCRGYSAWLGASILSQMNMFPQISITRKEYEENGLRVVHYKC